MSAKIIIIGNEILSGFTQDVNSHFLIKSLSEKGVSVENVVFVRDDVSSIIKELIDLKSINFIFLTGGLGPTSDDVTSKALTLFFDKKKPQLIKNKLGTATGLWYKKGKKNYFALPGVPSEMKAMTLELFSVFF